MLSDSTGYVSDSELEEIADSVLRVRQVAKENGSEFLYVFAPEKNDYLELPAGVDNYARSNHERFIKILKSRNIEVLDLVEALDSEGFTAEDIYFKTDMHWTPETGMWATEKLCSELKNRYGFDYNPYYNDINNYNKEVFKDWFLGSQGKKAGRYFSSCGVDDISLIYPKFETSMSDYQPYKNAAYEGEFANTVLYPALIMKKDYYGLNPYAAYSGGDFRLEQVANKLNPDGKRIFMIRDSYCFVVVPFLSLNASQVDTIDVRDFKWFYGEKLNAEEYINGFKPDYVIIFYSGVFGKDRAHGLYDFF